MLLDHFSGALNEHRDWHGFHQTWAIMLASDLNRRLPTGWFAEPNVQFQVEIDVAAFESQSALSRQSVSHVSSADVESESEWVVPEPTAVLEVPAWNDIVAVEVYAPGRPRTLAGAIELVSPSNKDRPESREQFVNKCERYLQTGIGLLIVDVVTNRRGNLHRILLERFSAEETTTGQEELFACGYQPTKHGDRLRLEMWWSALSIGISLPTLPLCLLDGPSLAVDLDSTYLESCRSLRIPNSDLSE